LHIKDVCLLHQLQAFFGGQGTLTTTSKVGRYTIVGISDIINLLIPHFNQYPLQSAKVIDYELWKSCILIMQSLGHLTLEGLQQIVALKSVLNFGLSVLLRTAFPYLPTITRPAYLPSLVALHPNAGKWIYYGWWIISCNY